MKYLLFLICTFLITTVKAQPSNDDCSTAIHLGTIPQCDYLQVFSNVDALPSTESSVTVPNCFQGDGASRDVWFSFDLDPLTESVFIDILSTDSNVEGISQPQAALYGGKCQDGTLRLLACQSSVMGSRSLVLANDSLSSGERYYLRISDYTLTSQANDGSFYLCVEGHRDIVKLGEESNVNRSCSGVLFDSGGSELAYSSKESMMTTICPEESNGCIAMNFRRLALEYGKDQIKVYEGRDTLGKLIVSTTATELSGAFEFTCQSECFTAVFQSDFAIEGEGFELHWNCESMDSCKGSAIEWATSVTEIPFTMYESTCGQSYMIDAALCETKNEISLGGPNHVIKLNGDRDQCIYAMIDEAQAGTSLALLKETSSRELSCIASSEEGVISGVQIEQGGNYYFVVSNQSGCTDFRFQILNDLQCDETPDLFSALCNPVNSCFSRADMTEDLRTTIFFRDLDSFVLDVPILEGVNNGCWLQEYIPGVTADNANFYWFTIKAYNDGQIGFTAESFNQSDLDMNVWGPFDEELMCADKDSMISIISSTQPVRSTYAPDPGITGLVNVNPLNGIPVYDSYDCDFPTPSSDGDNFVRTLDAEAQSYYVVLINDFDGAVDDRGVLLNWSGMTESLLFSDTINQTYRLDTAICVGDSLSLSNFMTQTGIQVLPNQEVSCQRCLDPVFTPTEPREYLVLFNGQCGMDSLYLSIDFLEGEDTVDYELCLNQALNFDIYKGDNLEYSWTGDIDQLSCADCPTPTFGATEAGNFTLNYEISNGACQELGQINIIVDEGLVPEYEILSDTSVCVEELLLIGGDSMSGYTYFWTFSAIPDTLFFVSNQLISFTESSTVYLHVQSESCPYVIVDSFNVRADPPIDLPISSVETCEGAPFQFLSLDMDSMASYLWTASNENIFIDSSTQLYSQISAIDDGILTLQATIGGCVSTKSVNVIVSHIGIDEDRDTIRVCLGDSLLYDIESRPETADVFSILSHTQDTIRGNTIRLLPERSFDILTTIQTSQCILENSIHIQLDSIPDDLSISPRDTSICEGSIVILESPDFNTARYRMDYQWLPNEFLQTGDSLYNAVSQPTRTIEYIRVSSSGACVDTSRATINVNEIPTVTITPAQSTICPNDPVELTASFTPPDASIEWTSGDGLSCIDCTNPTVITSMGGVYTLEVDNNGCPASASAVINITGGSPEFTVPESLIRCEGEEVFLNPSYNPDYTYEWSSTDPNFAGGIINEPSTVPPVGETQYSVTVTDVNNPSICSELVEIFTIIVPRLNPLADIGYCDPNEPVLVQITLENVEGFPIEANRVVWSNGDRGPIIQVVPANLAEDVLSVSIDLGNCTLEEEVQFSQFDLDINLTSSELDNAELFIGTNVDHNLEVNIDPSDRISDISWVRLENSELLAANQQNLNIEISGLDTVYTIIVRVRTENGCESSSSIRYRVIPIAIPNAFSPNDDGINDVFNIITNNSSVLIEKFQVFTRWGTLIYNNESPELGWDGTDGNNNPLPTDSYKYIINLNAAGRKLERQGEINLIR